MGWLARRLVTCLLGGFAGAAAGFVIYQLRTAQSEVDAGSRDITVAAPPVTASLAALIGLVSGRGALGAFMAGAGLTAALGTSLDERVTGIAATHPRSATSTSSSHSSG